MTDWDNALYVCEEVDRSGRGGLKIGELGIRGLRAGEL